METAKHVQLIQNHKALELLRDAVQIHATIDRFFLLQDIVRIVQQDKLKQQMEDHVADKLVQTDK